MRTVEIFNISISIKCIPFFYRNRIRCLQLSYHFVRERERDVDCCGSLEFVVKRKFSVVSFHRSLGVNAESVEERGLA